MATPEVTPEAGAKKLTDPLAPLKRLTGKADLIAGRISHNTGDEGYYPETEGPIFSPDSLDILWTYVNGMDATAFGIMTGRVSPEEIHQKDITMNRLARESVERARLNKRLS